MRLLLKWNLRIMQENPIHMLFTFIYMVFNYALLTSLKLFVLNRLETDNTDGGGILWYMATILAVTIFFTTVLTMYNTFQISIREREPRYRILSAAGTAEWQLRGSLFLEALILNFLGLILGVIIGCSLYGMISGNMGISDIKPGTIDKKLINGIKMLMSSIQLRDIEQFNGLSDIQRSGLRYYLIGCIELLKNIRLWIINMHKLMPGILRPDDYYGTTDYIKMLLPHMYTGTLKRFEGFQFIETPSFGFYCLTLEFLAVPAAMAMATRKLLLNGRSTVKKSRRLILADRLPLHGAMRRVFGVGGEINRLMDKRELSRRRFFLSAFVISITSLAIVTNLANNETISQLDEILYLKTSGDNIEFEQQLDEYIAEEDYFRTSEDTLLLRTYVPRMYCLLEDGQINAETLRKTDSKSIRYRPPIYSVSENGGNLILPEMIFLDDGKFDDLCKQAKAEENADALLLPGRNGRGEEFKWLSSGQTVQNWTLNFYTQSDRRFDIDETGKKSKQQKKYEGYKTDKIRQDYKTNGDELMSAVRDLPTEKTEVRVWEISGEFEKHISNLDRDVPVLVFPESARQRFAPYLQNTYDGLHLWVYPAGLDDNKKTADINFTVMLYSLRRVMIKNSDGCTAEHPWGTGTRYVKGDFCQSEIGWTIKGFHRYFYEPPRPIYADVYLRDTLSQISEGILFFCRSSLALMSFILLTNIVNTVYGHHILRRHEYAVLQSCGMSEKQTRRAILYEAAWYSLRSVIYGVGGYLLIYTPLLAALSYGESYEQVQDLNYDIVGKWQPDLLSNIRIAFINAIETLNHSADVIKIGWIFPLSGVAVFVLFLLINFFVRRHMRADTLVPLLKKDI